MMEDQQHIVIVGAGVVGLSLAAALANSGLKISIVDARPDPCTDPSPYAPQSSVSGSTLTSGIAARVSTLTPGSQHFLSRIGAWQNLPAAAISAFSRMQVWDARGTAQIEFGEHGELGFVVENHLVEMALIQALPISIDLQWQTKLKDISQIENGYQLQLENGGQLKADLLVGADGGNSRVRELCGIRTAQWSYEQTALVSTVKTTLAHGQVARQCFTDTGPLAFLPLVDESLCSIVWSLPQEQVESVQQLDDGEFCQKLTTAFEARLGQVIAVDKRFSFPLNQRHALQYVDKHIALIGDAAHTIHPLAGQGANLGFADARLLAQVILDARLTGRNPGDLALLKQYQQQRRRENIAMASAMEAFKRLYDTDNPGINWLRNTGMKWINKSELLKSMMIKLIAES